MVTEKGAKEIDAEWVLAMEAQSVLYTNRPGFEEQKIELANRFGGNPRDADVIWALLVKERLQHNSKKEWGLFRNSTFDMATLLKVDNRFRDALGYYLDVAYLDIFLEQQLLRELGQKGEVAGVGETSIAPAVIAKISEISLQLGLPTTEIEQYFFSRAETLKRANSKLPTPEFAWSIIKGAAI